MPLLIREKQVRIRKGPEGLSLVFGLTFAFLFRFWWRLALLFRLGTRGNWYLRVSLFKAAICVAKVAATTFYLRIPF